MGYDANYRRSSLRALHIRSKLRRMISDSTSDLDTISDSTEPTPPLTPVNGQIPRKNRKDRTSTGNPWLDRWSSCINLSSDAPEPAPLERYGSRSNLDGCRNDFDFRCYDPEFHLPSRVRFRETTELAPKLAVLPLRTRVTFSEPLPPTQIIESIAYASTKNHLSSTDGVKSSSPVNEVQKSTAIGSPTQNSSKKEKEENIWDRITHIEPTPIATVTAEPTRTSRPDSKSRLSDSSSTENRPEEKNRLGDELEKMREELERVKKRKSRERPPSETSKVSKNHC